MNYYHPSSFVDHLFGTTEVADPAAASLTQRRKRRRNSHKLRPNRIDWLIANEDVWRGLPEPLEAISINTDQVISHCWRSLVEKMKQANLVSQKTFWSDVNIPALIKDARRKIESTKGLTPSQTEAFLVSPRISYQGSSSTPTRRRSSISLGRNRA